MTQERRQRAHDTFLALQDQITETLADLDGSARFETDTWAREGGGGGRTRVIAGGRVFEKGGVNVSAVHGEFSEAFAKEIPGEGRSFFATGISLVVHPRSPHVPTVHANFRYLEKGQGSDMVGWFGGGANLTPWLLYEEDAREFHEVWRNACAAHEVGDYPRFKKWCDEYFYLPHRKETRGIGGIFFDYMGLDAAQGTKLDLEAMFNFVRADAGPSFLKSYVPVIKRRAETAHTDAEKAWQLKRRGRYVEFNLIYDRGTIFGLKTNGRTESILMSLPPEVQWDYMDAAPPTDRAQRLLEALGKPVDW